MTPFVVRRLRRLNEGRPVQSVLLNMIHTRILGQPVTFCVNMENDPIQRNHRHGRFYEINELKILLGILPKGNVFVDIGANVGNHALFAALILKSSKVIPFEPNPAAIYLLIENVVVNRLMDTIDLSNLGIGLSDKYSSGYAVENRARNIGATKMLAGQGNLEVYRGDDRLKDVTPDMIKIDVEGMEMAVLDGLSGVFERCKPLLLVEVDNSNEEAFLEWAKTTGYRVVDTYQRYKLNKNHILADTKKASRIAKKIKDLKNA